MSRPVRQGARITCRDQAGIALIDAIIAMLILAFSIAGLSSLNTGTLENSRHGRRLSAATRLAQDKLEEMRGLDYASVAAGSDGPLTETGDIGGMGAIYARDWTVIEDAPITGTKTVSVAITWSDKEDGNSVVIGTLVAE